MTKLLGFIGLGVGAFALLCSMLACSLPYWETRMAMGAGHMSHVGVWADCYGTMTGPVWKDPLESTNDLPAFQAVQAMVALGLVTIFGGVVAVLLLMFTMKDTRSIGFFGGAMFLVGGVCHFIAMVIYAAHLERELYEYGAGFALDIVAVPAACVAGVLVIFQAKKGGDSKVSAKGSC